MKVRTRLGLVLFRQVISGKETTYWKVMAVNFSWTLNIEAWVFPHQAWVLDSHRDGSSFYGTSESKRFPPSIFGIVWGLVSLHLRTFNTRGGHVAVGHGHSNVAFGWPGDFWMEPDWCFDFANRERPSLVFEFVYLQTATCKGKRRT